MKIEDHFKEMESFMIEVCDDMHEVFNAHMKIAPTGTRVIDVSTILTAFVIRQLCHLFSNKDDDVNSIDKEDIKIFSDKLYAGFVKYVEFNKEKK